MNMTLNFGYTKDTEITEKTERGAEHEHKDHDGQNL